MTNFCDNGHDDVSSVFNVCSEYKHTLKTGEDLMPQSHTHLRTLRMVRKARPQLSVHSVMIRITSAE